MDIHIDKTDINSVDLVDIKEVFITLFIGLWIALLVFIIEIIRKRGKYICCQIVLSIHCINSGFKTLKKWMKTNILHFYCYIINRDYYNYYS